jgi:hypothetical protein
MPAAGAVPVVATLISTHWAYCKTSVRQRFVFVPLRHAWDHER